MESDSRQRQGLVLTVYLRIGPLRIGEHCLRFEGTASTYRGKLCFMANEYQEGEQFLMWPEGRPQFPNAALIQMVFERNGALGGLQARGSNIGVVGQEIIPLQSNPANGFAEPKEAGAPLAGLTLAASSGDLEFRLEDEILAIATSINSEAELFEIAKTLYRRVPGLLNIEFTDPPVVASLSGRVGEKEFSLAYRRFSLTFDITTHAIQQERFSRAWSWWAVPEDIEDGRVREALARFQVVTRLLRVGATPWEFSQDVLLNLYRALWTLFVTSTDDTLGDVRQGLGSLGIPKGEIQQYFEPIVVLGEHFTDYPQDGFTILTTEDRLAIFGYLAGAESQFRKMFVTLLSRIETGFSLPPQPGSAKSRESVHQTIATLNSRKRIS